MSALTFELEIQLNEGPDNWLLYPHECLSEPELREAWQIHREELLARATHGKRPWGYWQWEALGRQLSIFADAGDWLFDETEAGCLERLGEATEEERRRLDMGLDEAEDPAERAGLQRRGALERWEDHRYWHEELYAVGRFLVVEDGQTELELPPEGRRPWVRTRGRLLGRLKAADDACSPTRATCEACGEERGALEDVFDAAGWLAEHWREAHP